MSSQSEPVPPPVPGEPPRIAGFWRRVLGICIDSLILGLVGWTFGLFFFDAFVQIGSKGRLIGFCVALVYFSLMNSRLFGGRTIGKLVVGTKVVRRDGTPIDLPRSIVRYLVLGIPFFLNGAQFSQAAIMSWVGVLVSILLFGLGGSILYLIVFNRRTRQSLHDLIVGSFVVRRNSPVAPITATTWKGHYVVVAIILIGSAALPIVGSALANKPFFKTIMAVQATVEKEPEVESASVTEGVSWYSQPGPQPSRVTGIIVTVRVRQKLDDYNPLANKIAQDVLATHPNAQQKDRITIIISYGYDIGIFKSWRLTAFSFSPADWEKRGGSQPIIRT